MTLSRVATSNCVGKGAYSQKVELREHDPYSSGFRQNTCSCIMGG